MLPSESNATTARLSIAFLCGAIASAVASISAALAIVPHDLPGRNPSIAELAVLALWVLALALGHRLATHRQGTTPWVATRGAAVWHVICGGAAFLLLAALTLLVAPVLTVVATRVAEQAAATNEGMALHVMLLIATGILLALGTGAASGSLVRRRR